MLPAGWHFICFVIAGCRSFAEKHRWCFLAGSIHLLMQHSFWEICLALPLTFELQSTFSCSSEVATGFTVSSLCPKSYLTFAQLDLKWIKQLLDTVDCMTPSMNSRCRLMPASWQRTLKRLTAASRALMSLWPLPKPTQQQLRQTPKRSQTLKPR